MIQQIVKFDTDGVAVYIDLDQVVSVGGVTQMKRVGDKLEDEPRINFHFKNGQTLTFNMTFKTSVEKVMDAWMSYINKQVS